MKAKNGKMYSQKQLLKSLKPCKKCGGTFQEFEERGESGIQKRLRCLVCDRTTNWWFQSISCIDEWNDEV